MNNNELQRILDRITGRGLIVTAAIVEPYLKRFIKYLKSGHDKSPLSILAAARRILGELQPDLAETLATTQLAAWTVGHKQVADLLPRSVLENYRRAQPPYGNQREFTTDTPEGPISFPWIESAARSLHKRGVMTADEYYRASNEIKRQSFTVSGDLTEKSLERVRDIIAEHVRKGASYKEFRQTVEQDLSDSFLYPGHDETVFRTNVQAAYSDGRESAADNPIIDELFPYQEYFATHDARTRPEHLALETLGLDGTNVYRRDDPVWDFFTPPWDYNCRCSVNLLTVEAAARRGVKEAIRWLKTGLPPTQPDFAINRIKFRPRAGFGQRVKSYA